MSWLHPAPGPGDLVAATRSIPVSLSERFTGRRAVTRGTRGVVRSASRNRLVVIFDTGYGATNISVQPADVKLIRRSVDEHRFISRASLKASIRFGALIALMAPFLWYGATYLFQNGNLDGLPQAIGISAAESALELPNLILAHPVQTLLWLGVGAVSTRLAFGKRKDD